MKLTRPSEVKRLLQELDTRPNRTLGQNFLVDANILQIILDAAALTDADRVLEIGPGLGVLTGELLRRTAHVTAVEKDPVLAAHLSRSCGDTADLELITGDVLDLELERLLATGITKVVANLPYSISSRILFDLAVSPEAPQRVVVTVQREVADRLASPPNTKDYGLLTVVCGLRYRAETVKEISSTCFFPVPEVTSAIVVLQKRDTPPTPADMPFLLQLLKSCFAQRRKQLAGIIAKSQENRLSRQDAVELLSNMGIASQARPENVAPDKWVELADAVYAIRAARPTS